MELGGHRVRVIVSEESKVLKFGADGLGRQPTVTHKVSAQPLAFLEGPDGGF